MLRGAQTVMSDDEHMTTTPGTEDQFDRPVRIGFSVWIGLAAVAVYIALAAGVANLFTDAIPTSSDAAEFALGHFTVLPVLIVAGVMFIRWAGWSRQVWRTSGAGETQPRRWWMLAIPVLLLVHIATIFAQVPWGDRSGTLIVVVLAGTAMVGFGEELYFRGILRATIRAHHGEFVTLLVTSLLFGLAHSLSSLLAGLLPTFVAFQVAATALDGAVLYGVFRATGRLWAAILLHGLNDAALYLVSADTTNPAATAFNPGSWFAITPTLLWALTAALVISCLREDLHARASRKHLTR